MSTARENSCNSSRFPDAVFTGYAGVALVLLLFLPLWSACSGTAKSTPDREASSNGSNGSNEESGQSLDSDVSRERLEKLLDRQQRQRLKPSENSPGPIMISLFSRRSKSPGVPGGKNVERGVSPGGANRSGTESPSNKDDGGYKYLILLSKEWAYENRPVREPFLDYARPNVKIMDDWQMNRFLEYLEEHSFSDFPTTERVPESDVRNLSGTEKFLSLWKGDRVRRVHFSGNLIGRMRKTERWSGIPTERLQKLKTRILIGFVRAYNAAGRSRMQVEIGPGRPNRRFQELADQVSPEQRTNIKEKLFQAKTLHKKGKHREAKRVLNNIMDEAKGTTFYVDARSLLQSINRSLNEE